MKALQRRRPETGSAAGVPSAERRLAAQYEVARALVDAERIDEVAPVILRTVCELLDWRTASLWIPDESRTVLRPIAVWSEDPELAEWGAGVRALELGPNQGLPGRAWSSARPVWVADLVGDAGFVRRQLAEKAGLRHGFAYPIVVRGDVLAVVECFAPQSREYDDARIDFLAALGGQLGTFLERAAARQALAASEARKSGVLAAAVDAIVSSDETGRILEFNAAAERLFGYARTDVLGRPIVDLLVPPELRVAHVAGLTGYVRSGEPRILGRRVRTTALRSDGARVPIELTVTEVRLEGRPMFTAFIRDISEHQQREEARDRFLEILSHELRTPVTAIYGGAKLLERVAAGSAAATELIADVGVEADRLHRLVEDLIVLARAERGARDLSPEPVHLVRVVERVVRAERPRAAGLDISIVDKVSVPPVLAEETYVEQVLRNLVSNAIKYGARGGIVEVVLDHNDVEALVRVLDRGPGIRDEEAARLFDIGYRSPTTTTLASGSGVGLFVARWLVEVQSGRIWARRRADGGSEFGFSLPLVDPEVDGQEAVVNLPAL